MTISEMTFEDAKREFREFLVKNGLDKPILWVFIEDVYSSRSDRYTTSFWLRLPTPAVNEECARRHFECGKAQGFGVALSAFASCADGLCCSFIVPDEEEDAAYMLMGPEYMRYSYTNSDMPTATVVRSKLIWTIIGLLRPWIKRGCFFTYLRSKKELGW
jgi:hypothetical protein